MEILTSMEGEENTNFDMEVTTTELVWRGIMAKDKSPAMAVLRKQLEIKPRVQSKIFVDLEIVSALMTFQTDKFVY